MAINYAQAGLVSPRAGVAVVTASGVLTAVDMDIREVYLQAASGNISNAYLRINATAAASNGFQLPRSSGTVLGGGNCLSFPIASLTMINLYMAETTDQVQVLYRS